MAESKGSDAQGTSRVLIVALVSVVVFLGFALVMVAVGRSGESGVPPAVERVNVLASPTTAICQKCHAAQV
ncbi:MAG: hypothetical protein P8R42_02195 [Candidatus Binatia bacterium]|nr:hypothetical protein [Candidatus Binatia bacterium]